MKTGSSKNIPLGMLLKKHYCRKCGAKLCKNPHTRLVSPEDDEWKQYSRIGRVHMLPVGDIEVTEYNFKCPDCQAITGYDEQVITEKIQKKLKTNTLSTADLAENRAWAANIVNRNRKIRRVIFKIISIIIIAAAVSGVIRSGKFEIRL